MDKSNTFERNFIELIKTNNLAQAQPILRQLSAVQLDKQHSKLAAVLGLLMLTKHPEFQHDLPQDSLFISHYKIVKFSLKAYQDKELDKLKSLLKQLPYRSAFKDFRLIVEATFLSSTNEKKQSRLSKIPSHSPYFQIAQLLQNFFKQGSDLFLHLINLDYQQRSVITELKELNTQQLEFIQHLSRQYDNLSSKAKFNIAIQYQPLYSQELAQQICQTLLTDYPEGQQKFTQHFGSTNAFEENRVKALNCERDDNTYDADYYWHQCIKLLAKEEDSPLKLALIYRHLADQQKEPAAQTELFINSLKYDSDDRDIYLQIIDYYSQQTDTAAEHQQWLQTSLEKFPQDIELLTLAIKSENNPKVAKEQVETLLKIDPLNIFAKRALFSNHLTDIYQLMQDKKYDLVEDKIHSAEMLNLRSAERAQLQMLRGFLAFINHNKTPLIEALNSLYSNPINIRFKATIEALLAGLSVDNILKECTKVSDITFSPKELIALNQQLKSNSSHSDNIFIALEKIKPELKKSLENQSYNEDILLDLCQSLNNVNHYELLNDCATLAVNKWNKPIWVYYLIHSETEGNPGECSFINIRKLQKSLVQAKQEKDHRAKVLIDTYLQRYAEINPSTTSNILEKLLGLDKTEKTDDPMEKLFGHIPDEDLFQLNEVIETLSQNTTPEQLSKELNTENKIDNDLFLSMMQHPDLFNALMVVRAAKQLNIEINVSVDHVFDYFKVNAL